MGRKRGIIPIVAVCVFFLAACAMVFYVRTVPRGQYRISAEYATTAPTPTRTLVNINTADAYELRSLPGIGPKLAQAIVDYRTENGPFGSPSEIMEVSGIGEGTYENIADYITTEETGQ